MYFILKRSIDFSLNRNKKFVTILGSLLMVWNFNCFNVWAAAEQVELSLGTAHPSLNDAILLNPAFLAIGQDKIFDISLFSNSFTQSNALGSFASGNSGFGYGIAVKEVANVYTPTLALAA